MDQNAFIQALFRRAEEAGFEACEVYILSDSSFDTDVHKGEIQEYNVSDSLNLGFRGLYKGKMGCASSEILDEEAIEMLVRAAKAGAELCEGEDAEFIFSGSESYPDVNESHPEIDALSAAEKIDIARDLEKQTLQQDSRIESVNGCGVFTTAMESRLVNSRGLDLSGRKHCMGAYVQPIARDGEKTGTSVTSFYTGNPAEINLGKLARKAAGEAIAHLDAQSIPSGKYRVLLRNDMAASLLRTFASVFSADAAQKGLSLLKGKEGEIIAAECVTLMDDPLMPNSFTSRAYDGEGVAAYTKAVIEKGRLNTLLHNLKTARKQGVESTGNAARASIAGPMVVAPSNFYFRPGTSTPEELYARAGDALLVTDLMGMHSGANSVSGDFSLGAKGFWIEGGKITRPVNQITIAGNFLELLKDIEAVADDLEMGAPGTSRYGSPTIMIRSLSVAGK